MRFSAEHLLLSNTINYNPFDSTYNGLVDLHEALREASNEYCKLDFGKQMQANASVACILDAQVHGVEIHCIDLEAKSLSNGMHFPEYLRIVVDMETPTTAHVYDSFDERVTTINTIEYINKFEGQQLRSKLAQHLIDTKIADPTDDIRMVVLNGSTNDRKC